MEQEIKTLVAELDVKIEDVEDKAERHQATTEELEELKQGKEIRRELVALLEERSYLTLVSKRLKTVREQVLDLLREES